MTRRTICHIVIASAALPALSTLTACSDSASGDSSQVDIVASTNVYGDIAATVVGEHGTVTSFIDSPAADPHSYESSSRNILAVTRADVVIKNGGGYDDFMDQLLDSAKSSPTVIDAVDVTGVTAPAGEELNEHVWYDLEGMQTVATAIADALSDADPDHAKAYADNAADFSGSLQGLIDREAALKAALGGSPVAITEPVPGYMIDALGLDNLTPDAFSEAIEEGEDVSVSVLDETKRLFTERRVDALIYNDQTTGATTQLVEDAADDAGIPVVPVTETLPDGDGFISWMSANLDAIEGALD